MNRTLTIDDSAESIQHHAIGHRDEKIQTKRIQAQFPLIIINGESLQSIDRSSNASSSLAHTDNEISSHEDNISEKPLPWQEILDQSLTQMADIIPNEPIIAHLPTWVNNLSYTHITETGSPYVSPTTTIIPQVKQYHKSLYSLFCQNEDELDTIMETNVNSSDYFPNPWLQTNFEECPQVSQTVFRPKDLLLCSLHNEKAPEHHHVIIPTSVDSDEDSNKITNLTEVAAAPDFHHWRPIADPRQLDDSARLQSDTMLSELAFQAGVKSRVQQWLIQTSDEEENDADEEEDNDGLDDAKQLEQELDVEMFLKN